MRLRDLGIASQCQAQSRFKQQFTVLGSLATMKALILSYSHTKKMLTAHFLTSASPKSQANPPFANSSHEPHPAHSMPQPFSYRTIPTSCSTATVSSSFSLPFTLSSKLHNRTVYESKSIMPPALLLPYTTQSPAISSLLPLNGLSLFL